MNFDYGKPLTEETTVHETAIDRLDGELERLSNTLDILAARLHPVSTAGGELEQIRPSEDSRSPLEARAIRLGELISQVDRLIRNLDI